MFNFCEVFVGRAMVNDAGRAGTCRRKFKATWLQTKVQKMKDLSKTWFQRENSLKSSDEKENRKKILDLSKKPSGIQGPSTRQLNNALVDSKS